MQRSAASLGTPETASSSQLHLKLVVRGARRLHFQLIELRWSRDEKSPSALGSAGSLTAIVLARGVT